MNQKILLLFWGLGGIGGGKWVDFDLPLLRKEKFFRTGKRHGASVLKRGQEYVQQQ
jgi:hypothetical protein